MIRGEGKVALIPPLDLLWRKHCSFRISGKEVLKLPTPVGTERQSHLDINHKSCWRVVCWCGNAEDLKQGPLSLQRPKPLWSTRTSSVQIFSDSLLQKAPRPRQSVSKVIHGAPCVRASPGQMHLDNSLCAPGILGSGMEAIHLACPQGSRDTSGCLFSCMIAHLPPLGSGLREGETWAQVRCLVNECFQNWTVCVKEQGQLCGCVTCVVAQLERPWCWLNSLLSLSWNC